MSTSFNINLNDSPVLQSVKFVTSPVTVASCHTMTNLLTVSIFVLIFGVFICSSHPILPQEEPGDQSVRDEDEDASATIRVQDTSDDLELLEPDLETLCFAQRPDSICFGSYLNSPHLTWTSGRGCLADAKEFCDTIIVMDTYLFPSRIKYTILLPASSDPAGDSRQQEALFYRLFLTSSAQNYWSYEEAEIKSEDAAEIMEDEIQFFQIFKNSTGVAISRSLVDGDPETKGENGHSGEERPGVSITGGGFLFPEPEEEGNGELVRDETTGKLFERYTAYSGSRISIGKLKKQHENCTTPLFLDLEQDEAVLHLEKLVVVERVPSDQPDDDNERKTEQVIRSPVLRLMSRAHDPIVVEAPPLLAASSGTGTGSFASVMSITAIDIAMGAVIIALLLLLLVTCSGAFKQYPACPCDDKCLQIVSRPFRRQRNRELISEFS